MPDKKKKKYKVDVGEAEIVQPMRASIGEAEIIRDPAMPVEMRMNEARKRKKRKGDVEISAFDPGKNRVISRKYKSG